MKVQALMISLFVASPVWMASSVFAASFGTEPAKNTATTPPTTVAPPKTVSAPLAVGPQVTGLFRIVKPDGSTVIQQTAIGTGSGVINVINVSTTDAFLTSAGKCAFNVKYDEVSGLNVSGTTNRLFSNDALIAQNTKIDLSANALKTIWTQPYLSPGQNNVRVVVNADSATPSTGWVRVNVSGTCGATSTAKVEPPKTEPPKTTPAPTPVPKPTPVPVVVKFAPGSAEWNNLFNAFGYSNYGVTQLKGKAFARYAELVKLNADITAVVNAKVVDQATYNALMSRWNGKKQA
jgi:hypothetical protein